MSLYAEQLAWADDSRIDFSQSFIPYTYIELHMPALPNGEPAIGKNYLHIWPRHSYMLIALPNQVSRVPTTLLRIKADSCRMDRLL